jgi:hypothetical protein
MALDHSRIRRFEASTFLAASECLPPSRVQLSRRTRPVRAPFTHTVPQAEPLLPLVQSNGGLVTRLVSAKSLSCILPTGSSARRRLLSHGSLGPRFPTFYGTMRRYDCHLPLSGFFACRSFPESLACSSRLWSPRRAHCLVEAPRQRQGLWSPGPPVWA